MKWNRIIKSLLGLSGIFAFVFGFAEHDQAESDSSSPVIFHQNKNSNPPASKIKEGEKGKSAEPAPLSSYRSNPPKQKSKNHLQNEIIKGALRLTWDLELGLRFDSVRHEGAANLTYTRGSTSVSTTGIDNTLSLTLVERTLGLKILFFNTAYIRGLGTYSVNSTNLHVRQNVNWAPALENFSSDYYIGDAYGYDAELALGMQGEFARWFSCFFELGGAYRRLWISYSHDLRYLVPFARLGNKFKFSPRWSFSYSAGGWAFGRRKELLSPVLINVYGVDLTDGSIETVPSLIRSGHVYGLELKVSLEYAISKRWGASLNYTLQNSRTKKKSLGPEWNTSQITGTWDERTIWNSHQVLIGVHAHF